MELTRADGDGIDIGNSPPLRQVTHLVYSLLTNRRECRHCAPPILKSFVVRATDQNVATTARKCSSSLA